MTREKHIRLKKLRDEGVPAQSIITLLDLSFSTRQSVYNWAAEPIRPETGYRGYRKDRTNGTPKPSTFAADRTPRRPTTTEAAERAYERLENAAIELVKTVDAEIEILEGALKAARTRKRFLIDRYIEPALYRDKA